MKLKIAWPNRISRYLERTHLMLAMVLAHPCPVSPRPWRKMMVAVCFPLGATTTGSVILSRRVLALTPRLSPSLPCLLVHRPPIHSGGVRGQGLRRILKRNHVLTTGPAIIMKPIN